MLIAWQGPLKYLWHFAQKLPKARFALIMPEANKGDLFNILNTSWFEPRNRIVGNELTDEDPPLNLCILFTENPKTANRSFKVMNGDEALSTRLTRAQTVAIEHGRMHDGDLIGEVEDTASYNPKLRFNAKDFAQFWCKNERVDSDADLEALQTQEGQDEWSTVLWDSSEPTPAMPTTMEAFWDKVSMLHVGDQHKLCELLRTKKRQRHDEETRRVAQRVAP